MNIKKVLFIFYIHLFLVPAIKPNTINNDPFGMEREIRLGKFGLSFIEKLSHGKLLREDGRGFRLIANCSVPICEGPLSSIYCTGPLIASAWYFGVKGYCPGSRLRFEPKIVLENFNNLLADRTIKKGEFLQFCEENFENVPYLVADTLNDWNTMTKNFERITDPKMRSFAKAIHEIWPDLTRTFQPDVYKNSDKYRVLAVPNRFIVPGGRFQVYYYWDSYWILKGMYFSKLFETARGMIENFAFIIRSRGFIPNSGNIELSRRSQPPYFTQMVSDYFEHTRDIDFLREQMLNAEKELEWWERNRTVSIKTSGDKNHRLYQFRSVTNCPRPENLIEDYELGTAFEDPHMSRFFWSSTTSACESGWDFSSRWLSDIPKQEANEKDLSIDRKYTETNNIVPLDLNVLMALNYRTLSKVYENIFYDKTKASKFAKMSEELVESIDEIFFDENSGVWFDYDLEKQEQRKKFYPTNVYPLILSEFANEALTHKRRCQSVLSYLKRVNVLNFKGGVPVSLETNSVEQWDFPNAWAPSVHLFVKSLLHCKDVPEMLESARNVAEGFLKTTYNGFFNPKGTRAKQIWEKYDARYDDGTPGFGGEYPPQNGFGWTNGVIMDFIRLFYMNNTNSSEDMQRQTKSQKHLFGNIMEPIFALI